MPRSTRTGHLPGNRSPINLVLKPLKIVPTPVGGPNGAKSWHTEYAATSSGADIVVIQGANGTGRTNLEALVAQTPPLNATERAKSKLLPTFPPPSPGELEKLSPSEWLVNGVLGEGDLGMIYGPSGVGKRSPCSIGSRFSWREGVGPKPSPLRRAGTEERSESNTPPAKGSGHWLDASERPRGMARRIFSLRLYEGDVRGQ